MTSVPPRSCGAATPTDVSETIAFAARVRMPLAVRSGGHSFAGQSSTPGIVIDVGDLGTVRAAADEVTVGAGARLGQVYAELDRHEITVPGGTCPSVGIAGLTLGGGLGILGRQYGVTSDRLRAAEIVLADGRVVRCDAHHDDELFWALRGGGAGAFGVVTSLTFDPVPTPGTATTIRARWSWPHAAAVIGAWQRWAPAAPDELAASLKVTVPPEPDATPSVWVFATWFGDADIAADLFDELVTTARAEPQEATLTSTDFVRTRQFWATLDAAENPPHQPARTVGRQQIMATSEFFDREIPGDAVDRLLAAVSAERSAGQSRELDFMPWAGAYNRPAADDTAVVHRANQFLLKHSTAVPADAPTDQQDAARRVVRQLWGVTHPTGTGRSFQNFADPGLTDPLLAYYGDNHKRLVEVKRRYDPTDVFRHGQSIPA